MPARVQAGGEAVAPVPICEMKACRFREESLGGKNSLKNPMNGRHGRFQPGLPGAFRAVASNEGPGQGAAI